MELKEKRKIIFFITLFLTSACFAQQPFLDDHDRPSYGVYGDLNINWHTADFTQLPGVPNCCPGFQSGSALGSAFGVFYEHPISTKFSWQVRAGYSWDGATLTATEGTTFIINNAAVPGQFLYTMNGNISTIGLEPYIKYNLRRFSVQAGFRAGYVLTKAYSQSEVISQPANEGTYSDGTRSRNVYSGQLPDGTSFHAGFMAGISYEFPMNKLHTLMAAPEAQLGIGVTPLVSGINWNSNVVRIGVSVRYIPEEDETPPETSTQPISSPPPTTPVPLPAPAPAIPPPSPTALMASVTAMGVDQNGTVHPDATIKVEQFQSLQIRPLLNFIFFDQDSSALPRRYVRLTREETDAFSVDKLHNLETLPLYYQVLNIIGKRMRENPKAIITVTGCNDATGNEKGNTYLSRMRAESVRDYFATVWNLPYSRMKVEIRNLPADSSDPTGVDGIQENRRVEISSDAWEIVQPVITRDTVVNVSPEEIRFRTNVVGPNGVSEWTLTANDSSSIDKNFSGESQTPPIIEWDLNIDQFTHASTIKPITYALEVHDSIGHDAVSPAKKIPINLITIQKKRGERVADKEIDHYSLILFNFNKSDLSVTNNRIVGMIKEYITPDATIHVTGYTDRTGDIVHNKNLSIERAQMTATSLGLSTDKAQGVGPTNMYDNNLPEGRFYCRTVDIIVERPVTN